MVASLASAAGGGGGDHAPPPPELEAALAARVTSYLDAAVPDGAVFLAERLVIDFPSEVGRGAGGEEEGGVFLGGGRPRFESPAPPFRLPRCATRPPPAHHGPGKRAHV
jgi:hypothetical protein